MIREDVHYIGSSKDIIYIYIYTYSNNTVNKKCNSIIDYTSEYVTYQNIFFGPCYVLY